MPMKLAAPIEKDFPLEKSDEIYGNDGEPSMVTIRQAMQGAQERRTEVFSEVSRVMRTLPKDENDEIVLRSHWSYEKLKRMEVYLTMADCNVLDYDGTQLFRFRKDGDKQVLDMTVHEFTKAWDRLYPETAEEIHEKVLEVNLTWVGPLGSNY
jgi:hypothetical protein